MPAGGRRFDAQRVYAAIFFIPLFYGLVRYLPPVAFFSLVLAAGILALGEFYRLHFQDKNLVPATVGGFVALSLLLVSAQWPDMLSERVSVLTALMFALLTPLAFQADIRRCLMDSAILVFGVLYIGLTLSYLPLTRSLADGTFLIFFLVLITWAGDTGAYYAGTLLGRHRLAPRISPNKTVEGLIGGLILSVILAHVARAWFVPTFSPIDCWILGLLLTTAGVIGDLAESLLKRSAGVKDSGGLIPGHGGMLDRLDSLLFTGPAFYYYVTLVKA